jgi:lactate dehydrogenase-like 2-hydroxyacid dehydrogenase
MFMAARRLPQADRFVRDGKWLKGGFPLGTRVSGKKLGILGLGRIGKAIAKRAEAFGMDISYYGRKKQNEVTYRYYDKLVDMAAAVEFMIVICPGGAETKGIVNAEVIKALGKKGTLVNVARGSVIDEPALVKALKDGTLGAAGLDVFADEPKVPEELFALENVTLLPHLGSATHETRKAMADLVVANLRAHLKGEKLPTRYA